MNTKNFTAFKCVVCEINDVDVMDDPFVTIYDINLNIEITYDMCLKCVKSSSTCSNCEYVIDGPYHKFYVGKNKYQKCHYCHNGLPIPEENKQSNYDENFLYKLNKYYGKSVNSNNNDDNVRLNK
jgi:hypothetical protein